MIKQSKLLKIKSKILSNLFNEKYGLKLGEFNNTTWTERVKRLELAACSGSAKLPVAAPLGLGTLLQREEIRKFIFRHRGEEEAQVSQEF